MERRSSLSYAANVDSIQLKRDFIALFNDLAKSQRATLNIQMEKGATGSDVVAILTPLNPRAARIDARLELDFGVYLLLGQASPFEIPFDRSYYAKGPWLEEVRDFCLAVLSGDLRESLIVVGEKVRGSDHQLVLPNGKRIAEQWRDGIIKPWSKKIIRYLEYEPY